MSREQPVEPAPDLKPCPFCGGPVEMLEGEHGNQRIECIWCDATSGACDPSCVVESWNRRAPIEVLVPRPEPLTREVDEEQMRRLHENGAVAWAVQGPAIEDRALLDAMQKFAKAHKRYSDRPWSDGWDMLLEATEQMNIECRRAALSGVEPRPQDRQEGVPVSVSSEPSASGGAVQRPAGGEGAALKRRLAGRERKPVDPSDIGAPYFPSDYR